MNVQKLAEVIYDLDHDREEARAFRDNGFRKRVGDVCIERSDDCMMFYLWWHKEDQARAFWKCVPAYSNYSKRKIEEILEVQAWMCI